MTKNPSEGKGRKNSIVAVSSRGMGGSTTTGKKDDSKKV
jgi:hypothetical protein